jgi:nucleoside-diphosphate-sugar epimerase
MTRRVVIIGANGRLGSELALRLNSIDGLDVVGICRNMAGSAFIRLNGVACRLGSVSDRKSADNLLGDGDVIVNLAYTFPRSSAGHRTNVALVENSIEAASPDATVILASTIMVYGPAFPIRCPDAYGLEKLRLERAFLRRATRRGVEAHVFRIGHALGDLQPLTRQIEAELRARRTSVSEGNTTSSNTIHVASLAEAITMVGRSHPKVIDLVSSPQWTWGQLYSWYASGAGVPVTSVAQDVEGWGPRRVMREAALVASHALPEQLADRMYGRFLVGRARRELATTAALETRPMAIEATRWRGLKGRPFSGLSDPMAAIDRYPIPPLKVGRV